MVQLRFNSLAGTDPMTIGPAPFYRLAGPLLQQGPDRVVVARYFDYHWEIGNRFVSSYESIAPVSLYFEGPSGTTSEVYGPFQQVRFPNGSCYADRTLFAELVTERGADGRQPGAGRGEWMRLPDLARWHALIITPATPR